MPKLSKLSLCLTTLMLFISTEGFSQNIELNQSLKGFTDKTIQGWQSHLSEIKSETPLQEGCQPFIKLAKGKVKGNVMLFHGYTACPQQFLELSEILSNKGYNTFAPLLPGHGKSQITMNGKHTDQSNELPDENSSNVYREFAKNISKILQDEPETKIIGGISTGAIVTASAMIDNPDIYDRGFMVSPFFTVAPGKYGLMFNTIGKVLPQNEISWGEECENSRKIGRVGYCNFKIGKLLAVEKFGKSTLKEISKINKPMQVIGVENDASSSTADMIKASRSMVNSNECFFPEGAVHSLLSRYDDPQIEKYWMNPLLEQLARYIDTGRRFDTVINPKSNFKRCRYY